MAGWPEELGGMMTDPSHMGAISIIYFRISGELSKWEVATRGTEMAFQAAALGSLAFPRHRDNEA